MSSDGVSQPVLLLCAAFEDLPASLCSCPDRCRIEQCALCLRDVHYDPRASIPALGREVIVCLRCIEQPGADQTTAGWPAGRVPGDPDILLPRD
jgi:hypothetical protein